MPASLALLAFLSHATTGSGCSYEYAAAFRDADVAQGFDPVKMAGYWYENAYADPGQVGAKCQTLTGTYNEAKGGFDADFSVTYGPLPFTIKEHYVPHDPTNVSMKGVLRKTASAPFHIPGGGLLGMPTSIVKAKLSPDKSRYESVVMYSCVLGKLVNEIVIATRGPTLADVDYQTIVNELKSRGLPAVDKVKRVDFSECEKPEPEFWSDFSQWSHLPVLI